MHERIYGEVRAFIKIIMTQAHTILYPISILKMIKRSGIQKNIYHCPLCSSAVPFQIIILFFCVFWPISTTNGFFIFYKEKIILNDDGWMACWLAGCLEDGEKRPKSSPMIIIFIGIPTSSTANSQLNYTLLFLLVLQTNCSIFTIHLVFYTLCKPALP